MPACSVVLVDAYACEGLCLGLALLNGTSPAQDPKLTPTFHLTEELKLDGSGGDRSSGLQSNPLWLFSAHQHDDNVTIEHTRI
eukprot:4092426-Amphidinium_carterae.1